jgi:hypothetical protein
MAKEYALVYTNSTTAQVILKKVERFPRHLEINGFTGNDYRMWFTKVPGTTNAGIVYYQTPDQQIGTVLDVECFTTIHYSPNSIEEYDAQRDGVGILDTKATIQFGSDPPIGTSYAGICDYKTQMGEYAYTTFITDFLNGWEDDPTLVFPTANLVSINPTFPYEIVLRARDANGVDQPCRYLIIAKNELVGGGHCPLLQVTLDTYELTPVSRKLPFDISKYLQVNPKPILPVPPVRGRVTS